MSYGDDSRQGGGYGDDFSSTGRTGGGLGADDTFGSSTATGGRSTGRDNEFGQFPSIFLQASGILTCS